MEYPDVIVGHLVDGEFKCPTCSGGQGCPVYRVNIGIYSQQCAGCKVLVVEGVKKADKSGPLNLFDRGI